MNTTNELTVGVLKLFCAASDSPKFSITEPFRRGDYVYATDGKIAIQVTASLFPEITGDEKAPSEKGMLAIGFGSSLDNTELFPLPRKIPESTKIYCGACMGTGECICDECDNEHRCGKCGGGGHLRKMVTVQLGVATVDSQLLLLIQKLPNPTIEYPAEPERAIHFKFDGGRGLVMPVRKKT